MSQPVNRRDCRKSATSATVRASFFGANNDLQSKPIRRPYLHPRLTLETLFLPIIEPRINISFGALTAAILLRFAGTTESTSLDDYPREQLITLHNDDFVNVKPLNLRSRIDLHV